MAATLAAIAVTAVVVGMTAVWLTRSSTTAKFLNRIGGRKGADPVDEHRRMLQEAKNATAAATARSDLLQLSLDALTSGVIVTDRAGKVVVRNRFAADLSPRPHEQTLIAAATTELLAAAAHGERVERELEIFGPPPRTLFLHAVPISADADVIGALAVVDDVTDHHRIEKTRRDFIANLSHELRTPVGAASLLGEMLVDEEDATIRQQLTDRLMIETDRMTVTIDDLLTLSRIESHEDAFDQVVEVQALVDEAVERTRVVAESAGVAVGSILPAEPITMTGNRDQLLTALVNLVENAVKYSDAGDSVSVRSRLDGDDVFLTVQDTGRGIPARDLDRIFERFYRVDRSRDASTGGSGIGLSIVRHVALNHGGTVEVSSFEGDGSTFTMALPLALWRQAIDAPAKQQVQ